MSSPGAILPDLSLTSTISTGEGTETGCGERTSGPPITSAPETGWTTAQLLVV